MLFKVLKIIKINQPKDNELKSFVEQIDFDDQWMIRLSKSSKN